jgi:hypothetical protein
MKTSVNRDVESWQAKIDRLKDRAFNPTVSRWAICLFNNLAARDGFAVAGKDLSALAADLRIPLKFIPRAVATLTRLGIVSGSFMPSVSVQLLTAQLKKRKNPSQKRRRPMPASERDRLLKESDWTCGCCNRQFPAPQLHIDHLIPISLLGADEPANWVVLCKAHNHDKWDRFLRGSLRVYRGEKVTRPFGVRFRDGYFWPVINGRPRLSRCDGYWVSCAHAMARTGPTRARPTRVSKRITIRRQGQAGVSKFFHNARLPAQTHRSKFPGG